ncbi:MAG: hypothetical protein Q8P01_05585 [bacterium]|nr:hypothetical protein [bacterium]
MAGSDEDDDADERSPEDNPRFERDVGLGLLHISDEKLHRRAMLACRREARRASTREGGKGKR